LRPLTHCTPTVIPAERSEGKRIQVFDTITVVDTWLVRMLSLRTPSQRLMPLLAGDDKMSYGSFDAI
jgi:hypothetical protein